MALGHVLIFIAACLAAASTGMIFPPGEWYDSLRKPGWTPPRWAFPAAWTTIYILIAVAAARVSTHPGSGTALAFWSLQIALNTLWTPVFFGAHLTGLAFVIILFLSFAVILMIPSFWALDGIAALLLLPYLLWLLLAASLNYWIWRFNAV